MSKDLINIDSFQLPAYLQDQDTETSSSLVTQREAVPRISIRGHRFRLKKDGEETTAKAGQPLNVVILGASPSVGTAKSWYKANYSSDSDDAPDCSSADGVKPDSWVDLPQCSNCASCPKNEWGSATDQDGNATKGKACNDVKKLLVASPDNLETGDVYVLQVPPTSLKALSSYGRQLAKHNIPVEGCITSMNFVDSEFPQLEMTLGGFLDAAGAGAARQRSMSPDVLDLVDTPPEVGAAPVNNKPVDAAKESIETGPTRAETEAFNRKEVVEQIELSEKDSEIAALKAKLAATGSVFDGDDSGGQPNLSAKHEVQDLDNAGDAWSAELHSSTKSKTNDGRWTKRRNRGGNKAKQEAKQDAGATQEQEASGGFEQPDKNPSAGALDDILNGSW